MTIEKYPVAAGNPMGYWVQKPDTWTGFLHIDFHGRSGTNPFNSDPLNLLINGIPASNYPPETPKDLQVGCNQNGILLIAPQANVTDWTVNDVNVIIDIAINKFKADPAKIGISGFSMGGDAVTSMITSTSSNRVAWAISCNGVNAGTNWANAKNSKVWFFHAMDDNVVGVGNTQNAVASMKAAGGNPSVTYYPNGGHSYLGTYKNQALYDWMKGAATPPPPPPPTTFKADAGPDVTINTTTYELDGTASTGYKEGGWIQVEGPGNWWNDKITDGWSGIKQQIKNLKDGVYTFTHWVKDASGKQLTDNKIVTVKLSTTPPVKKVFVTVAIPVGAKSITVYEDKTVEFLF